MAQLCKKVKNHYDTCPQDICNELAEKTEIELIDNNDQLAKKATSCLIKMRVANSGRNEGQSGGFRVITFIDLEREQVTLLEVYPKTGRYNKADITEAEKQVIVSVFLEERKANKLKTHDLLKGLAVKEDVKSFVSP